MLKPLYKCFMRHSLCLIIFFVILLLDIRPSTGESPPFTFALDSQIPSGIAILAPASDKVVISECDKLPIMCPTKASHLPVMAPDESGAIRRSQNSVLKFAGK